MEGLKIGDKRVYRGDVYELVDSADGCSCDACAFFREGRCPLECLPEACWKVRNSGRVYISGAIAHHDLAERKRAFREAAEMLEGKGFTPVNPFDNGVPDDAHWRKHMRADIALLTACDYIYMLPGWEMSKGAKLEHDVATSCGIRVLAYGEEGDVL